MKQTFFTFENLLCAYKDCRKNKGTSLNHLVFFADLEKNLVMLEKELVTRRYRPGCSIAFVVLKPKVREIFAAEFRDRVVHHLLYNYLSPIFERFFIYDSWACREAKGTHRAVRRVRSFMTQTTKLDVSKGYFLQMDIKSFFMSIDKTILYNLVTKRIKNEEILWLTGIVLFHDCVRDVYPKVQSHPKLFKALPAGKSLFKTTKGIGLPIGNLTSQFFANIYLNELDLFVKHQLKAKYYARYVDDFVIVGETRQELERYKHEITKFLWEALRLEAHPKKQIIRPTTDGINFLGYIIRADYILIRKRVVGEWRRKIDIYSRGDCKRGDNSVQSYRAHAKWANAYWLTKKNDETWENRRKRS